ncbi:MAG TPA: Gx transporter family protein [bacterium]|nr:Gx transporter family protein [bacterium]
MSRKITEIAVMTALAAILFSVESLIPTPVPWLRLGLANVVSLLALYWWGLREALLIAVLRVLIAGLFTGRLMQPVFVMSMGGSLSAVLGMWLMIRFAKHHFSLIGVSIWGALCKNTAQLAIVSWLYISRFHLIFLLPGILFVSLASGLIIGALGYVLDRRLSRIL